MDAGPTTAELHDKLNTILDGEDDAAIESVVSHIEFIHARLLPAPSE